MKINQQKKRYPTMIEALKYYTTTHPIFYSICNWGEEDIRRWGKDVGNRWITIGDIRDMWLSMLRIIDINNQYYEYGKS